MVTIDIPACVALGSAVALRFEKDLSAHTPELRYRSLLLVVLGFVPLGLMFDLYHHDWEWQYFAEGLPPAATALFVMAMVGGGIAGFELTRKWLLDGKKRAAQLLFVAALGFTSLYSLVFYSRVFWIGSRAEWLAGTAPAMWAHPSFQVLLVVCGVYLTAACVLGLRRR
jgi:hypothetical protein